MTALQKLHPIYSRDVPEIHRLAPKLIVLQELLPRCSRGIVAGAKADRAAGAVAEITRRFGRDIAEF